LSMSSPHPESKWTHPICKFDFIRLEPGKVATMVYGAGIEICCWCGNETSSGIYYRADPKVVHPE